MPVFGFQALPQELKDMVYQHLVFSAPRRIPVGPVRLYHEELAFHTDILLVSKKFKADTSDYVRHKSPHQPPTLSLRLVDVVLDSPLRMQTAYDVHYIIQCLDRARITDATYRVANDISTDVFVPLAASQVDAILMSMYTHQALHFTSQPAFSAFVEKFLRQCVRHEVFHLRLMATDNRLSDAKFLVRLRSFGLFPGLRIAVYVPANPRILFWRNINDARLWGPAYPGASLAITPFDIVQVGQMARPATGPDVHGWIVPTVWLLLMCIMWKFGYGWMSGIGVTATVSLIAQLIGINDR